MGARDGIPRSELGRLALASLPGVAVVLFDGALRATACAGSVRDSYGLPPDDIVGLRLEDLLAEDSLPHAARGLRLALGGRGTVLDVRTRRPEPHVLELKATPLLDDDGAILGAVAVSRDVTAERAAQDSLRESERRYRLLVEASTDLICRLAPDGTFLWVSPAVERLLGRGPAELVGRSACDVAHPDDRAAVRALLQRAADGLDEQRQTYRMAHRDGRWPWVEMALRAIRDPVSGSIVELVGTGRDVSDRVRAEDALARGSADLGHFASLASHDLAEPLVLVRGYADLLRDEAGPRLTASDRRRLDVIARSVRRMQSLVGTLLSYATVDRSTAGDEQVDVAHLLDEALALLEARIAATGAEIRRGPLAPVRGDARLLGLLLQNLISNAMKFCERRPVVEVSCVERPAGWELVVTDNGVGIAPQDVARIFGLFVRVDAARFPGLGLGLATAWRIAELHGGAIAVESTPGVGSTFRVSLPRVRG